MEALLQASIEGLGIVRLSAWNVREDVAAGRLVTVQLADAAVPDHGIWAVLPIRRFIPGKVRLFLDALAAHLVPLGLAVGEEPAVWSHSDAALRCIGLSGHADALTFLESVGHRDAGEPVGIDGERVFRQDGQVCEFAGGQRSLAVVLEVLPGGPERHCL
jgi:hypothetical protein